MSREHKVTVEYTLADEDIDNIMDSAMRGCSYWADSAEPVSEVKTDFAHEVISKNGTLNIHDTEEEAMHEFTLEKFKNGLALAIRDHNFELKDYDMYDADRVVQLGLFGELVYG